MAARENEFEDNSSTASGSTDRAQICSTPSQTSTSTDIASAGSSDTSSHWNQSFGAPNINSLSKYSRFVDTGKTIDAIAAMRDVMDSIIDHSVPGPQLFRLGQEFNIKVGHGTQFEVMGPSKKYQKSLQKARRACSNTQDHPHPLIPTLENHSQLVIKRALWIPDVVNGREATRKQGQNLSAKDLTKELHSQLWSAKVEIDKLCHGAYANHPNIVRLLGWGLCLDTFESKSSLNTRIPLLILERATCDLATFLMSSNHQQSSFDILQEICSNIGTGLGALHAGNMTHGDMKPENVLLFAEIGYNPTKIRWRAKLCDFGNAEAKSIDSSSESTTHKDYELFQYYGTPGWVPPEAVKNQGLAQFSFDDLKACDIFVYGLIVWYVFTEIVISGKIDSETILSAQKAQRRPPINEEKIEEYCAPHKGAQNDRAYRDASASIKRSGISDVSQSAQANRGERPLIKRIAIEDRFPSDIERRLILKVLRTALQPIPKLRDSRPWKFFNTNYYSISASFNEAPLQESTSQVSSTSNILLLEGKLIYLMQMAGGFASTIPATTFAQLRQPLSGIQRQLKLILPSREKKSSYQIAYEIEFARLFEREGFPKDSEINGIDVFSHDEGQCYDLHKFRSDMTNVAVDAKTSRPSCEILYAFARLRSRFKQCCWHRADPLSRYNVSQLAFSDTGNGAWEVDLAVRPELAFPTIAWLFRGEIGRKELVAAMEASGQQKKLWELAYSGMIPPKYKYLILQLFIESGCYVGIEVQSRSGLGRRRTLLSECLASWYPSTSADAPSFNEVVQRSCYSIIIWHKLCISLGTSHSSKASRRFFFTGQSPDGPSDEASTKAQKATTILHEAVNACSYRAMEHFLSHSIVPLFVEDCNGQTALDLALELKVSEDLNSSQKRELELIIGLLTSSSGQNARGSDEPRGWERIDLEPDLTAYCESTINPDQPSLTFLRPTYSLLQKTKIQLGSRSSSEEGLTYPFDLVRFMHKPNRIIKELFMTTFTDRWYVDEIKQQEYIEAQSNTITWSESSNPLVQIAGRFLLIVKTLLLRSYINILLPLVPICIVLSTGKFSQRHPLPMLCISIGAIVPLLDIWEAVVVVFSTGLRTSTSSSFNSLVARLGNVIVEIFICFVAVQKANLLLVQHVILGSIFCNQLLHLEQVFNHTSIDTISTLNTLFATFSSIIYVFASTASSPADISKASAVILSRGVSVIAFLMFMISSLFRHKTHTQLFDIEMNFRDGYESDDNSQNEVQEPLLSPLASLLVAITVLPLLFLQAQTLVFCIQYMAQGSYAPFLVFFCIPIVVRGGKHFRAILLAIQDRVDESLDSTLGFVVTLCFFATPILVFLAWQLHQSLTLNYGLYGTISLWLSAWMVRYVVVDGKSNYLEGIMMIIIYVLIVAGYIFVLPLEG